jgi:ubiquinone/menaquinone biosynthesis C-methylase UbiE
MAEGEIRFDDGASYEDMMGVWSRLAGEVFIDWLKPSAGLKWIDIGCGNGAATAMIVELCVPSEIQGIDPSEGQLGYARSRLAGSVATFCQGEGAVLPFPNGSFDIAVMALVIFFLPDPAKGVVEMARVVRPGGTIATYGWDLKGGGFTLEPIHAELRKMGISPRMPPSPDAASIDVLRRLWTDAGIEHVETREIVVQRTFDDFENFWASSLKAPGLSGYFSSLAPDAVQELKRRVQTGLPSDAAGRVTCTARANAIKGRKSQ